METTKEGLLKFKAKNGNISKLRQDFAREGFVKLTDFFPKDVTVPMQEEAMSLVKNFGDRRELTLHTTSNTPRVMTGVKTNFIEENSKIIPSFYDQEELKSFLGEVAGEKIFDCPAEDEKYLIFYQNKKGDSHGWHWGDFSYALIWVLKAPPIEKGGMLQCIPHTEWDKSNPKIHNYICERPIHTHALESYDVYFLKSDTTLHRTITLIDDAERLILNMTYGNQKEIDKTIHTNDRWWN